MEREWESYCEFSGVQNVLYFTSCVQRTCIAHSFCYTDQLDEDIPKENPFCGVI